MEKLENIEILYTGNHIRIGKAKANSLLYIQPLKDKPTRMWFRFDPEYYYDYKEYLADFEDFKSTRSNDADPTCLTILNEDTLNHYIQTYRPHSIYVNDECIYSINCDVSYDIATYCEDMYSFAKFHNYYPHIEKVQIDIVDNGYSISFITNIKRWR